MRRASASRAEPWTDERERERESRETVSEGPGCVCVCVWPALRNEFVRLRFLRVCVLCVSLHACVRQDPCGACGAQELTCSDVCQCAARGRARGESRM